MQRAAAGYASQAQEQQDMLEPLPVDFGSSRQGGAAPQPYQMPVPGGNGSRAHLGQAALPQVRRCFFPSRHAAQG